MSIPLMYRETFIQLKPTADSDQLQLGTLLSANKLCE